MKIFMLLLFILSAQFAPSSFAKTQVKNIVEITATSSAAIGLAANRNRNYLLVQNAGSYDVYLKFDSAPTGTDGIKIAPGGNYEAYEAPINSFYVKTATSPSSIKIYEGND